MYLGVDEPWIAQLATRFVGRDDIVYDIGAHIGYTVLLFAKGSPKFIEAFEMLPPTASALERTIAGNGLTMARVHTVGLGSRRATLELPVWRSMTSMYFEAVAGETLLQNQYDLVGEKIEISELMKMWFSLQEKMLGNIQLHYRLKNQILKRFVQKLLSRAGA